MASEQAHRPGSGDLRQAYRSHGNGQVQGHRYESITLGGSSSAHFGDVYNFNYSEHTTQGKQSQSCFDTKQIS